MEVVQQIGKLYAVERQARQAGMDFAQRLALRQAKSAPLMAELKTRLVEIRSQLAPSERLAKACDYALGQWPANRVAELIPAAWKATKNS